MDCENDKIHPKMMIQQQLTNKSNSQNCVLLKFQDDWHKSLAIQFFSWFNAEVTEKLKQLVWVGRLLLSPSILGKHKCGNNLTMWR